MASSWEYRIRSLYPSTLLRFSGTVPGEHREFYWQGAFREAASLGTLLALATVTALILGGSQFAIYGADEGKQPMLSHDVFFTLKQDSPEARAQLVAACKKYLSQHPGIVWFAAGGLAEEFQRDVNDRDFDVALHIDSKAKPHTTNTRSPMPPEIYPGN